MSIVSKQHIITRTGKLNSRPDISELEVNFYPCTPSEVVLHLGMPKELLARFTFGTFESSNLTDIRNIVSPKENNALIIENDEKLYVENKESTPLDFLAYYLVERG